jgi:plasmid stabilization system protein ParE
MKRYRVEVEREATSDILNIFRYISEKSPANAAIVSERIWDEIKSLAVLPRRYEVHRSSRRPERVVRSMSLPPFIIYYRIPDQQSVVQVLTVRHGARRQPRSF